MLSRRKGGGFIAPPVSIMLADTGDDPSEEDAARMEAAFVALATHGGMAQLLTFLASDAVCHQRQKIFVRSRIRRCPSAHRAVAVARLESRWSAAVRTASIAAAASA